MKKLIAALLAAALLLACVPGLAEADAVTFIEELGVGLDTGRIAGQCENSFTLRLSGVLSHEPYAALAIVTYNALPSEEMDSMRRAYEAATDAEKAEISSTLSALSDDIAYIVVTDAPDIDALNLGLGDEATVDEVYARDQWHNYLITFPIDDLLSVYDDPASAGLEMTAGEAVAGRERVAAEVGLICSELAAMLAEGEHVTPVDTNGSLIGLELRFESTDLDGNPVDIAELFSQNRITMVNLWGTWCSACLREMGELAQLHARLREKGCGIVGVEYEKGLPLEQFAENGRTVLNHFGIDYPNVIRPEGDPILGGFTTYPTTLFVDSEGTILTYPIVGAAVDKYEKTVDSLLAGIAVEPGAKSNGEGRYRVYVRDPEGNPVEGVLIQFCDDTLCSFQPTDADGLAAFEAGEEKVYDVHVLKAPEGFAADANTYHTLDTWSDVTVTLERAD